MAIFDTSPSTGICPRCGSRDVKVEFRKIDTNKNSTIVKKSIKCNDCGYKS